MADAEVMPLERPVPIPTEITLTAAMLQDTRFSPNDLRALRIQTGKGLTDLIGPAAPEEDRFQTIAWLRLRRDGHPAVNWNDVGDLDIRIEPDADPTSGASTTTAPHSADSGG